MPSCALACHSRTNSGSPDSRLLSPGRIGASLALSLAAALSAPALAQTHKDAGGTGVSGTFDVSNATKAPLFCQITATPTATSLASLLATAGCANIPPWASVAVVTPEATGNANAIALRWRADGAAPTATVGDPIFGLTKDPSILGYNAIVNASLISATGANVTVDVRIGG